MPTALPGMSVTEAQRILQIQDRILRDFPEVERVFGKAGRADTPTDPAPFSMVETTVLLQARVGVAHGASAGTRTGRSRCALCSRASRPSTSPSRSCRTRWTQQLRFPGIPNIWTHADQEPHRHAVDRRAHADRHQDPRPRPDGHPADRRGRSRAILRDVPGTRSVLAERTAGGYYLDFDLDRDDARALRPLGRRRADDRHVGDRRRERHHHRRGPRALPGQRALRARLPRRRRRRCSRVLVPTPSGAQVPLAQLADIRMRRGPGDDPQRERPARRLRLRRHDRPRHRRLRRGGEGAWCSGSSSCPTGYTLVWSGQYENMVRVRERLTVVVPLTLFLIALLLYLNTKSAVKTGDRAARGAVLAGRRRLAALRARLQHLDRRLGRA